MTGDCNREITEENAGGAQLEHQNSDWQKQIVKSASNRKSDKQVLIFDDMTHELGWEKLSNWI